MEEPNFWDNPEEAQEQMKQLSSMKEDRDTYQKLVSAKEDMETLIEMGQEEDDDSVVPEIAEMMEEFKASFDAIRIKTLLSGEFDKDNAIIKLNAGAGGTEACDWCGMLYRMYTRWAERKGFTIEELDFLDGDEAGVKSVTFQVNGENAYGYLKSEKGVHRLVRISPFNAAGKRQTSFVLVYTTLLTIDNRVITIPNSSVSSAPLTNLTRMGKRRLIINVGIGYSSDLLKAKNVLKQIFEENPYIMKDQDIQVIVDSLGDSSVNLSARGWVLCEDYWKTKWAITEEIKLTFDREGIEIPYQYMNVTLTKESQ